MQWIKASERLPERWKLIDCRLDGNEMKYLGHYDPEKKLFFLQGTMGEYFSINRIEWFQESDEDKDIL